MTNLAKVGNFLEIGKSAFYPSQSIHFSTDGTNMELRQAFGQNLVVVKSQPITSYSLAGTPAADYAAVLAFIATL